MNIFKGGNISRPLGMWRLAYLCVNTEVSEEPDVFISLWRQTPHLTETPVPGHHYTALYNTIQHYTARHYTARHYTALYSTPLYSTIQHATIQHYTAHHYTAHHYTARHYTAHHYTARHFPECCIPNPNTITQVSCRSYCLCLISVE